MKNILAGAAMALVLACGAANANTLDYLKDFNPRKDFNKKNFYIGLQAANADINGVDGTGDDIGMINGTVGFFFKWGISLEARVGIGSDQGNSLFKDPTSRHASGMLRYHYTWSNDVMAYAGVGGGIRLHSSDVDTDSTAGLAAAFGLNLFGNDKTALNVEYLYMGGADASSSFGIGFQHYFGKF